MADYKVQKKRSTKAKLAIWGTVITASAMVIFGIVVLYESLLGSSAGQYFGSFLLFYAVIGAIIFVGIILLIIALFMHLVSRHSKKIR